MGVFKKTPIFIVYRIVPVTFTVSLRVPMVAVIVQFVLVLEPT